jgi:hypothetical protein
LAASVKGVDSPDILNAEPERLALVIVSDALPLLVSVTLSVAFPPTETVPNASVAGETDKPAAVPVPVSATETVPFEALLATDKVPLRLPACCGANWICTGTTCPAPTVIGKVTPLRLKLLVEMVACETVTAADPVFDSIASSVVVEPTATVPKLMLSGADRVPSGSVGGALLAPVIAQPESSITTTSARSSRPTTVDESFERMLIV